MYIPRDILNLIHKFRLDMELLDEYDKQSGIFPATHHVITTMSSLAFSLFHTDGDLIDSIQYLLSSVPYHQIDYYSNAVYYHIKRREIWNLQNDGFDLCRVVFSLLHDKAVINLPHLL